jgi:LCP family protein required for cell wall assembly
MRDSRVSVEGHGEQKLKYAYSYGGPQLLIKTINRSFKMNIKDYVKVDFFNFEKIINYVGGVDIDVKANEINLLNDYQKNIAKLEKSNYIPVKKAGLQTLNGKQAVAYCRIRYVGNNDFERTERQRRVMSEILRKVSHENLTQMSSSLDKILPFVETSLKKSEMISLGSYVLMNGITKPDQFRIPTDQNYHDYTDPKDNLYYMLWDKEPTINALHKFIFETELYNPPQNLGGFLFFYAANLMQCLRNKSANPHISYIFFYLYKYLFFYLFEYLFL